jgi:cullin-associated NEDD8-dissociated protein 1
MIFEILDPTGSNLPTFLLNSASTVNVGGGFEFHNPPMYNSPVDQTPRDALYETDAILHHYMGHSNAEPFIATRLIQLLITSTPSPRYVKRVAQAFKSGLYSADSVKFGTGQYGDLEATTAAIYLDREARSSTLDLDATSGKVHVRERSLLKLMHFLRAMELGSEEERELNLANLDAAQSVFSFFSPSFQSVGPVRDKGLVSPESQMLDSPNIIGFINGVASLPTYGLSDCQWSGGLGEESNHFVLQDHPEE